MTTEQIVTLSDEAAARAAREGRYPYTPWSAAEVAEYGVSRPVPFPNLGSYRPAGWALVEDRLVDKTGWGYESEPALTLRGLREWVTEHVGDGWALIEEGEFQVVIGRFHKEVDA